MVCLSVVSVVTPVADLLLLLAYPALTKGTAAFQLAGQSSSSRSAAAKGRGEELVMTAAMVRTKVLTCSADEHATCVSLLSRLYSCVRLIAPKLA